jgi:hypothetical protein
MLGVSQSRIYSVLTILNIPTKPRRYKEREDNEYWKGGKPLLVDDEDKDLLESETRWFVHKEGTDGSHLYFARHGKTINGKREFIHLHRVILSRVLGRELDKIDQVDHINHDGLDNRRENLRLATHTQNIYNRRKFKVSSSKYKGITLDKRNSKWMAQIQKDRICHNLGYYDTEEDAARAYDVAAKLMFGSFCCINFPEEMKE